MDLIADFYKREGCIDVTKRQHFIRRLGSDNSVRVIGFSLAAGYSNIASVNIDRSVESRFLSEIVGRSLEE